jgi:sec-independent protein translocase protein TatC
MFKAKKPSSSEDMFADTRMTFGEHIEDLRVHLWRAIIGFVLIMLMVFVCDGIGLLTGTRFGIGRPMLDFIISPLRGQLAEFKDRKSKRLLEELETNGELKAANRPHFVKMSVNAVQLEAALRGESSGGVIPPLPENGQGAPFRQLMGRAQLQSAAAQDALEASRWQELKKIAEGLQETAQAFLSANKVPDEFRDKTDSLASDLGKQAEELAVRADGQKAAKAEGSLREIIKILGDQGLISLSVRIDEPVRVFAGLNQAQGQVSGGFDPKAFSVMEAFMAYFKVSLICGLVLGSPWIFLQIWAFIAAGLYPHEKRLVNVYLPFSLLLFLIGALSCQFIVIPRAVGALLWFNEWLNLEPELRFNEWLSFAILMPLVFGISFQLPLVMMFLERLGIMTVQMYYSYWKIAFFLIHVVAAILMPSPDIFSMELLAIPMFGLYGLGILLCRLNPGKSEQDQDVPQSEEMVEV